MRSTVIVESSPTTPSTTAETSFSARSWISLTTSTTSNRGAGPTSGAGSGTSYACGATTRALRRRASSTAQRSASFEASEPSIPTTIFSTSVF